MRWRDQIRHPGESRDPRLLRSELFQNLQLTDGSELSPG